MSNCVFARNVQVINYLTLIIQGEHAQTFESVHGNSIITENFQIFLSSEYKYLN